METIVTSQDQRVADAPLTREEVQNVSSSIKRLFPLPEDGGFDHLLEALDRAESSS